MTFKYNKFDAMCSWCKRTANPHPSFANETIPTKTIRTAKGRKLELCFSCYEVEQDKAKLKNIEFEISLDQKFENMKILGLNGTKNLN